MKNKGKGSARIKHDSQIFKIWRSEKTKNPATPKKHIDSLEGQIKKRNTHTKTQKAKR